MTRKFPAADVKILYAKASGLCSFEDCRAFLILETIDTEKTKQIGKIAHIIAHSPAGPRADLNYPQNKLDTYDNWILLCPTCHDIVDALESKYGVERLRKMKDTHEKWVQQQLSVNVAYVTFAELDVTARAIASKKFSNHTDFKVIPPIEKMIKNHLTDDIHILFTTGLSLSHEIQQYLSEQARLDANFPERLKEGFRQQYFEFKKTLSGDALFFSMFEFSKAGKNDFRQQTASLAVLCHLFELCEIFEK